MESKSTPSQQNPKLNFELMDQKPGIGGVLSISEDTFKVSLEEAIDFMKVFRCSIDEKLWALQEIAAKRDYHRAFAEEKGQTFDHKTLKFDEIKAQSTLDLLQLELNRWRLGNAGISLAKTKND